MDAEGSATGAETDDAAPAVSQHALQLQMAFRRLNSRGSRWNGAYSGKQGMPVADFVQHGCDDANISSAGWRFTKKTLSVYMAVFLEVVQNHRFFNDCTNQDYDI